MQKIEAKNKALFYIVSFVAALFLAVSITPQASAAGEDTIPPDDVENLQIEVFDGAVKLSWDVATDDTGVTGYKLYSGPEPVTAEEGDYSYEMLDVGDVIEALIEGLPNGDAIYFTITAYDADGNESEAYSNEVNGTPDESFGPAPEDSMHDAADEEAPTVAAAQALDNETVEIIFSEAVVLPAEDTELAFSILNNVNSESLVIVLVEMDPDDVLGQTVLLTTDPQDPGTEYILTAGIQVEDTAGNPITSGTSDTAAFIGSSIEPGTDLGDLPDEDLDAPELVSAVSVGINNIELIFSEPIILDSDPEMNFFIAEEADALNMLDIVGASANETGYVVRIETSDQESVEYSVIVTGVIDEAGNAIEDANSALFMGNVDVGGDRDDEFSAEFEEAFSNCEEGETFETNSFLGKLKYEIEGMEDDKCKLTFSIVESSNLDAMPMPDGTYVTCLTDNSYPVEDAFGESMSETIAGNDDSCEGTYLDIVMGGAADNDDDDGLALTPENVKNFVASLLENVVVLLSWEKSDDPSVIDQILYRSTDGGESYDEGTSLGMDRTEVEVSGLTPGNTYNFKLTTMDADGNESEGMFAAITLPGTGMGLGLLFGASLGLAAFKNRKRK